MWNEKIEYPENPDAYTIEVEATNNCNARCVFVHMKLQKIQRIYRYWSV